VTTVICAVVLLGTSPILPMTWDEGNAIDRAALLPSTWLYTTRIEGHPAFYGIVIAVGRWISSGWLPPLESARFGPILLFTLAAGVMYYRMASDWSTAAAAGSVAALMLLPRMFAHAHFASTDGPLTSCWILAWASFVPAVRPRAGGPGRLNWPAALLFGVALGMTLATKATGWLAPSAFLVWAALYRDRVAAKALAVALPAALVVFFLLNPPLWSQPLAGWRTFFSLNFNRAANPGLNISTWFLGQMYNLDWPLPWYNTLLWTAVTVPAATLGLAVAGIAAIVRRPGEHRLGMLLIANWLVLMIVRALPCTPPHDGVRLFLPAFAFLAALAGVGCGVVFSWAARRDASGGRSVRATATAALALMTGATAANLVVYAPQWLSYYNLLIGGLPGATALGMEPTYYWDGLDRSVLDWLEGNTAEDERILFAASSPENFALMQQWDMIRRTWAVPQPTAPYRGPGPCRWYVLQRRPSGCYPVDVHLIEHAQPAHRKTLLGVPLVEVYDYRDYRRAWEAIIVRTPPEAEPKNGQP
jgi:4-amino-4-deoxy-L-arabinose transferase-like glycosyltransferase